MGNTESLGEKMKKLMGFLLAIFGLFIALQSPTNVQAANFKVSKYDVQANVLKDGNVDLTQKITYDFNDEFHGVYYTQNLAGVKGATDPKVYISEGKTDKPIPQADTGKNNTYQLTRTKDSMEMKVFHAGDAEQVTFVYKYRVLGVITNYLDTSELNWKIIGDGWENDLNDVKVTIQLPQKNVSKLQAWTHGPLGGHNEVEPKNGRVVMTIDKLNAGQFMESHMIFPTTVTPDNTNKVNKKAKADILANERAAAISANKKRQQEKAIYIALMIFAAIIIAIIYIVQIYTINNNPARKHFIPTPLYHIFDEPKFIPSMTQVILERKDRADSLAMTADILYEVGKHRMKIEKFGNKDYTITALVPPTNTFFKYLFEKIGDGKSVSIKQIRKFARNSGNNNLVDKFDDWATKAADGREKYLDLDNLKLVAGFKSATIGTDIILFIMFAISMLMSSHLLVTALILLALGIGVWGIYFWVKKQITPYTDLGEQEVNQIRAFKRMLEDIDDIKMAEVGDLILWEQFLPYAVVFGVSDNVIRALRVNFGAAVVNQSSIAFYYIGAGSFARAGNTGFQTAFLGAMSAGGSSSISGGSGGFSGGSSGGFGGGSGGGAF